MLATDMTIHCPKHLDYDPTNPPADCERCKTAHLLAHQDPAHSERPHHPESASSLQPKEWCPAYTGRDETNEAAEIGTKLHEHAERGTTEGLDDEEAALVQMCLDHVAACEAELKARYGHVKKIQELSGVIDRVEWPYMKEKSTSGGFVDVVLASGPPEAPVIHVIDYKFGAWPVEPAANNLQGIVYLLNYRQKHPTLAEATVSFLMPKLGRVDTHTFTAEDFPKLYTRVKRLVDLRARLAAGKIRPETVENPCYTTCMWCGNLGACKAVAKDMVRAAEKFAPLAVPKNLDIQSINARSDVSEWVKFSDVLKSYAGAVRARCTDLVISNPKLVPETHTLQTQAEREVADYSRLEAVMQEFGVPDEVIDALKKIGLTEAKRAVGDAQPRGAKTARIKEFDEALVDTGVLVPTGQKIFLKAKRETSGE